METYETEEQQVAAIKAWWKENYKKVVFIVVLGIGGILGAQSYQKNQQLTKEAASEHFNQLISGVQNKQEDIILGRAELLKNDHANSPYAIQASLIKAKTLVDKKEYESAINELSWAAEHTKDESLKQIAFIRKIKLMMQLEKNDQAIQEIKPLIDDSKNQSKDSQMNTNPFMPVLNEIYGDLLASIDKKEEAKKAYDKALSGFILSGVSTELLQIKRNDLGE